MVARRQEGVQFQLFTGGPRPFTGRRERPLEIHQLSLEVRELSLEVRELSRDGSGGFAAK
jgi:hypothetical protein